ncbi:hypothetical protein [Burkholderia vietnamiensis]|uniref:hypothetical protein n=1 Tax=Burkholderia vietnamiensis TaxID=60552 RepID=UPI00265119DF|nr:hypothetical protein [Burkholderia vietnamiensis]MDN7819845.1 hypothetical protein [Burkholderia vietnamiensis]
MNPTEKPGRSDIALVVSLAVLFVVTHPYTGIRHDAILYTAQALHNLHPDSFAHDLFFQYGSQDRWTIYGRMFALLVSALGLRASNLACLIAAQALWWTGIWRLARQLLPTPWHWVALLFVACMPADYGAGLIFSYDEGFVTARLPAEALGLWAIASLLERRYRVALALTVVAAAVHPLIGGAALAFVALVRLPRVAWWRLLPIALIAFAVVEMPAFHALHLDPFDPEWRAIARYNVPFLFPTLWSLTAWSKLCWAIALPAALSADPAQPQRALWSNLALIGVAGVAATTIADLTGQDALWIQLQPWRTLWLLSVMQWPAAILLVRREARVRPTLVWLLAICWLLLDVGGGIIALAAAAALHVGAHRPAAAVPVTQLRDLGTVHRAAWIGTTLIAAIVWFVFQCAYQVARAAYPTGKVALDIGWLEALIHTHLAIVPVALLVALHLSRTRLAAAALPVTLAALAAYGFVNLDQRSAAATLVEASADRPALAPFARTVARGDIVYWDGPGDEVVYPWFLMKTSSYYSSAQAAGLIFNRRTTFEAVRRVELIRRDPYAARPPRGGATAAAADKHSNVFVSTYDYVALTAAGIRRVCADPVLDFIVSRRHYPALATRDAWSPDAASTFWLYDCGRIRTAGAAAHALTVHAQPRTDTDAIHERMPAAAQAGPPARDDARVDGA